MIKLFLSDKNKTGSNEKWFFFAEKIKLVLNRYGAVLEMMKIIVYFEYGFADLQFSILISVFKNITYALDSI